jgi:hypothetical protein
VEFRNEVLWVILSFRCMTQGLVASITQLALSITSRERMKER